MCFRLTGGNESDYTQALALLDGQTAQAVLADKGYDSDGIVAAVESMGADVVIPPRSRRLQKRSYDRHLYAERNSIERMFNRLKQFRRIATRYDKLASSYLSFLCLAGSLIWLN